MEGLISLLLVAGLFFLMMRFGCGAHIAHGGHEGHGGHGPPATGGENTDPVCGMPVPADSGYAKMYQGKSYRFCSRTCLDKFDADPQQYLSKTKEGS